MRNLLVCLLFTLIGTSLLTAQVFPKEGSRLNYRIIGFSLPLASAIAPNVPQKKLEYRIEIAKGTYNTADSFNDNIIISSIADTSKMIIEVPAFGAAYTWRLRSIIGGATKNTSRLYHFSTMIIPYVDTATTRFRILKSATAFKDAYVFLDNTWTLYDMMGDPVWFLPDLNATGHKGHPPRFEVVSFRFYHYAP